MEYPQGLLNHAPDPIAEGLIGFGAGLLTPRSQGGGFGAGLLGANQGVDKARAQMVQQFQMRRQMEQDDLRKKLLEAQVKETEAQAEQRKHAVTKDRESQQAELTWRQGLNQSPPLPPNFNMMAPGATQQMPRQSGPFNSPQSVIDALRFMKPEEIKLAVESHNLGKDEVARTVESRDSQNRPGHTQYGKFGQTIGDFIPKAYERKPMDIGGKILERDPYTGATMGEFGKTMTPGEVASNKIAQGNLGIAGANLGLSRQRFGLEQQKFGLDQKRLSHDMSDPKLQIDLERGVGINPRTLQSQPITKDGSPLGPKPDKMSDGQKKELLSIDSQSRSIDDAIKAAQATPSAFSFQRGMATEGGTMAESLAGRRDSTDERTARSRVFNEASSVITQRAGLAQTKQELARINSFLPANTDNSTQIIDKLNAYKEYLATQREVYASPAGRPSAGRQFEILEGGGNTQGYTVERP